MKLLSHINIITTILIGFASVLLYQHRIQLIDSALSRLSSFTATVNATQQTEKISLFPSHPAEHLVATDMSVPRTIRKAFLAVEQSEGAGARVRRSIGTPQLKNFSPFLMLDHFTISPGAGFPDQYVSPSPLLQCC